MHDLDALRRPPTTGLGMVSKGASVALAPVGNPARLAVRAGPDEAAAIGGAFGVELPTVPLRFAARDTRTALWLGPDEWLLLADSVDAGALMAEVSGALAGRPHSVVDVSHRNAGFLLSGHRAADVLNAGCPLPLHLQAFPVGKCTRTLFGKAEIVLWRTGESAFRIEVWRSFAAYVAALIAEAARDPDP